MTGTVKTGGGLVGYQQPVIKPTPHVYDPRLRLTIKATRKKVHHICGFLPEEVRQRMNRKWKDVMKWMEATDGTVVLKAEDQPKLSISQAEWGAANMRVMFHLLQVGDLSRAQTEDYMSFTLMMHELSSIYEWQTVLDFDVRYRELQAQYEFRWGESCVHLEDVVLVRRLPPPAGGVGRGGGNGNNKRNNERRQAYDSNEKCRLFLRGDCPYGADCRYKHEKSD